MSVIASSTALQAEQICLSADGDFDKPETCVTIATLKHVEVPVASGSQKKIYALPPGGSLASLLLDARSGDIKLVVPDGGSALHIRALLDSGAPISGLEPRIRINGEPIPPAVLRIYARRRGIALMTDASGELTIPRLPAGMYELTLDKRGNDWTRVVLGDGETTIVQRFASN